MVTAVILWTAWTLRHDSVGLNSLTLVAGWFVGALIAEARVAHLARGPRRVASLAPRVPSVYVSRLGWNLLPTTVALSAVVAILSAVVAATSSAGEVRTGPATSRAAVWFGVALAVAAAVRLTQIRVLRRPQPLASADVIAADDAIRSRSLHVLSGGGGALVLYCVLGQLNALGPPPLDPLGQAMGVILGIGTLAVPVLGYVLATRAWRVDRQVAAV